MKLFVPILLILSYTQLNEACRPETTFTETTVEYSNESMSTISRMEQHYLNLSMTIIESDENCESSRSDHFKKIYCHHDGKCVTKFSVVNKTHVKRESYCICQKVCLFLSLFSSR